MPKGLRPVYQSSEKEPAIPWLSYAWPALVMAGAILIGLILGAHLTASPDVPPAPTPAAWPGAISTYQPASRMDMPRRALLIGLAALPALIPPGIARAQG